jgi:hypothetical protein
LWPGRRSLSCQVEQRSKRPRLRFAPRRTPPLARQRPDRHPHQKNEMETQIAGLVIHRSRINGPTRWTTPERDPTRLRWLKRTTGCKTGTWSTALPPSSHAESPRAADGWRSPAQEDAHWDLAASDSPRRRETVGGRRTGAWPQLSPAPTGGPMLAGGSHQLSGSSVRSSAPGTGG